MPRLTSGSTLILTAALIAGVSAAPAFAATAAKATSLNLRSAHATVAPKAKDTLTGTLKAGNAAVANEKVTLEQRSGTTGKFSVVRSALTNSKGLVTFTVTPGTKKGQKEQYELVHASDAKYKASHSQIITVTVK